MDTFTTSKLQMSENLSPLKLNDGDERQLYEVDENQENNGMKRQRFNECVQMSKIRNNTQQPCACEHTHENCLRTVRCIATAAESPINITNGTMHLKGAHHTNSNCDTIKSNGFYQNENSRENNVLSTPSDDYNILANLCDGQTEGYFDSMVSSDLSDAEMKLAEVKEKCTNAIEQNNCNPVINRGHRRTRARSTDSVQAEFYQARKQQMRLQSQNGSDVSSISVFRKFNFY